MRSFESTPAGVLSIVFDAVFRDQRDGSNGDAPRAPAPIARAAKQWFALRLVCRSWAQALEASRPATAFAVAWDGPGSEAEFAWACDRFEPTREQFGPTPPGVEEEAEEEPEADGGVRGGSGRGGESASPPSAVGALPSPASPPSAVGALPSPASPPSAGGVSLPSAAAARHRARRPARDARRGRGARAPAALSVSGREFAARLFSHPSGPGGLERRWVGASVRRLRVSVPPRSQLVFFGDFLLGLPLLEELDLSGYDRYNFDTLLRQERDERLAAGERVAAGERAAGERVAVGGGPEVAPSEAPPTGETVAAPSEAPPTGETVAAPSEAAPTGETVAAPSEAPAGGAPSRGARSPGAGPPPSPPPLGLVRLSLAWAPGEDLRSVSLPRRLVPSLSLSLSRAGPLGAVASQDGPLFAGPERVDVRSEELLVGVPSDDEALVWEFERPYREGDFTPPHIWGDDEAFRGSQRAAEDAAREFKRRAGRAARLRQLCFRGNYVSLLRLFPVPPEDPQASIAWLYGLVRLNVQALAGFSAHELGAYRIYEGRRGVPGRGGGGGEAEADSRAGGAAGAQAEREARAGGAADGGLSEALPETWAQLDARATVEELARRAGLDAQGGGEGGGGEGRARTQSATVDPPAADSGTAAPDAAPTPRALPPVFPAASGCFFAAFDSRDPLSVPLDPLPVAPSAPPTRVSGFPRPPLAWHPTADTAARDGIRLWVTRGWERNELRPLEADDGRGTGETEPRDHDMDAGADWWNED